MTTMPSHRGTSSGLALTPAGGHALGHRSRIASFGVVVLAPFRAFLIHREAIQIFVNRDLRARYVNSALGLWWAVIQPLALLALYTFVFSRVMGVRLSENAGTGEFALYLFCGLLPWLAVSDGLTRASSVLIEQAPLIKKVVFPSEILPIHVVLSAVIVEIVGLAVFLLVVLLLGRVPGPVILTLPFVMILQVLFTTGLAWLLAVFAVYLRDVRQVVGLGLTLWMFLTPIVYQAALVPPEYRWVLDLNPMTTIVAAYRGALLENRLPALEPLLVFAAVSMVVFIAGHWVFTRAKPAFADLL